FLFPRYANAYYFSSSVVDRQFSEILTEEIKQETESALNSRPPNGFSVSKHETTQVFLEKSYPDGVILEVEMDLAGSIAPEDIDETDDPVKESNGPLDARPEFKIRLKKPSGRSVLFHCSFPSKYSEDVSPGSEQKSNLPTFSVDMVEMERLPGYFVYTDLFDDNLYEHTVRLLTDRGIDSDFQRQLQDFATSEEHKLYTSFLEEFKSYCKE
ncbi:unnamed protein product, partial [Schistocephalus solidus]|uniref:Complement component 1 Q subcomponent-binding protein, mitochondrial n=1 Tax=Schistocephalus solidus TaxID=70667 RepID=A0A183T5B2_SCHSO